MNIAIVRAFIATSMQLVDLYEEMLKGLKWFKRLKGQIIL
jgi:hypothetical protein